VQGDKNYIGATPGWVIWQVLKRYSSPGDVVIDPMAGSGTTIDVAKDLARETRAFDLAPTRDDIERADARELPVDDEAADVMFIDPPYSTHVDYSDDPACIGKLDALVKANEDPALNPYYAAMTQVIIEAKRVLKPGGTLALYVSDSYRKGKPFMPIGFELFSIMRGRGMTPVDIVAVARGNEKLGRGNFHKAAEEQNFFLRGFNYLLIMQKQAMDVPASKENARSGTKKGTSPAQRGARSSGPPRRVAGRKAAVGGIDAGPKGGARKAPKASGGAKPKRPSNKPNRGPLGPKTRNTKPGQRRNKPGGKL
jgi:DNA modification methylase